MAQLFRLHPESPQLRLVRQVAAILREGGVVAWPTDSCYGICCHIGDKLAMERIREIRGVDERHHFALVCRTIAQIGLYARIDDRQYRVIRSLAPGPYAFILHASREVPRRLQHPRGRTIGFRLPAHPVVEAVLDAVGEPLVTSTLQLPGDSAPLDDGAEIVARIGRRIDAVIDAGHCGIEPSTVIDMTGDEPVVLRIGRGPVEAIA
jgi:tRNA threonylcarbamoyl adenosine modification protein (Sua5/YciO/YrdC/YwlC family)